MADSFGLLTLPASATDDPIGDPALAKLGAFLAAVINANAIDAWPMVEPSPEVAQTPAVRSLLLHDPEKQNANDEHFPALFVWRESGEFDGEGRDDLKCTDVVKVLWVFPAKVREEARAREQFLNVVVKSVAAALSLGRDPTWVDSGDTDATAATVAANADSFLTAKATSLAPVTYSGASLDGILGDDTLSPRLSLDLYLAAASSGTPYNTASPIVVTYLDVFGDTATASLTPTHASNAQVLHLASDMQALVSIAVPAQNAITGSISGGNAARAGRGSSLFGRGKFDKVLIKTWRAVQLRIELDGDQRVDQRLPYHGVSMTLEVAESLTIDATNTDRFPLNDGGDLAILQGTPFDDGGSFVVRRTLDA